jgi:hypothetical protein
MVNANQNADKRAMKICAVQEIIRRARDVLASSVIVLITRHEFILIKQYIIVAEAALESALIHLRSRLLPAMKFITVKTILVTLLQSVQLCRKLAQCLWTVTIK